MVEILRAACLATLLCVCSSVKAGPVPLTRVHAHNDYEHKRPLLDALDQGFCSVEADIFLVDGQLLVAHDRRDVRPQRTLQALYLDPLRQRVLANAGAVYPGGPEFTLLIDLKQDWKLIYPALRDVLKQYADLLVTFQDGIKHTNAILVVITGDRSKTMFDGEAVRYASLDGELSDLDSDKDAGVIPWISSNWSAHFKWRGTGQIPAEERARLADIVTRAHKQGRRVRFWGSPDQSVFWQALLDTQVDLINTDDLQGAQQFLTSHGVADGR